MAEGTPIDILWDNLQRLTNPISVVNILHMSCIPKFKKNNHNLYGVILADYDGALFSKKRYSLKHNPQIILAVLFYH
jgi:hypothetical protein